MAKLYGILFAVTLIAGIVTMSSTAETFYTQTSCEIDPANNAVIGMKQISDVGKPGTREYNIDFQPLGIVVRFPPIYYAPNWKDTEVIVQYPSKRADSGVLRLRSRTSLGLEHVTTIGTVRRSCWDSVKKYIREHVESEGVVTHILDIVKK